MLVSTSKAQLFCLVFTMTLLTCTGSVYYSCACYGDIPKEQQPASSEAGFLLLRQVWADKATEHDLEKAARQLVWELFCQIVKPGDCRHVDAKKLEKSLDLYFKQFRPTFSGKRSKEACYWMSWLLAQYAKRPEASKQEMRRTNIWFKEFVDEIITILDEKTRNALGEESYNKLESQVQEALDWTKQVLQKYFDRLHDDALFPALKKPISDYANSKVFKHLKRDVMLIHPPTRLMELEEEAHVRALERYFNSIPSHVMFWTVLYSTKREFEKDEYWGGMLHSARSRRDGAWPIQMYLRRKPDLIAPKPYKEK